MGSVLETIKKLHSFRNLDSGWRFGMGGPPDEELIHRAEYYINIATRFNIDNSNVFTGNNREVVLGFYNDGHDIEITFEADGSITFAEDQGGQQIDFVEHISEVDLFKRIWQFRFPNTYVQSIRETSTRRMVASTAQHLALRAMAAESQSSSTTVHSAPVEPSVNTSTSSTVIKPNTPASIGSFLWTPCQTGV